MASTASPPSMALLPWTRSDGNLTVNQNVSAGSARVDLTAGGAGNTLANNAAVSNAGGYAITLIADRMVSAAGSAVFADDGPAASRLSPAAATGPSILASVTDTAPNTLELAVAEWLP